MHKVTATTQVLVIPTHTRQPARRLPAIFKEGTMYPDTRDDILDGELRQVAYQALVLENEFLRLTVLPELGGKLWSVYDKIAREDAIYVPSTIKPGLIWSPGAWIPGGMEFNFPIGHHIYSLRPLPCSIVEAGPECGAILVDRRCRRSGLRMTLRIALRAGEGRFTIDYAVFNPSPLRHRWYQWTNVGILCHDDWRFFSKANLYCTGLQLQDYPVDDTGLDTSYVKNRPLGSDSFMIAHREDFFGCYDYRREHGLAHVAPWREMLGKKYFTWGKEYRNMDSERVYADDGRNYLEIQAGPLETQMDFDIFESGAGRTYGETWIPFRRIGGIEWADRDLIFHVRDGAPWIYSAAAAQVRVKIGKQTFERNMPAATPLRLPAAVCEGTPVEITVNGQLRRKFHFPFEGRQEPNGRQRAYRQFIERLNPNRKPRGAADFLEKARQIFKADFIPQAIARYRTALQKYPGLHAARLELADALWHTADFDAGEKELRKIEKTSLAAQVRALRARRPEAERLFREPLAGIPEGPARKLATAERYAGYNNSKMAHALYRQLLREDPGNYRVPYGLALYHQHVTRNRKRAAEFAERALKLKPGDRDLLIELCPLLMWALKPARVVRLITDAPPAVRDLSILQKMLAGACFETGDYKKALQITSTRRLYNWESEMEHVDVYINSALALAERALRGGRLAEARRYLKAARHLPVGLGTRLRPMIKFMIAYWDGQSYRLTGQEQQARKTWRGALDSFEEERKVFAIVYGDMWFQYLTHEAAYFLGLCGVAGGEPALKRRALALMRNIYAARLAWDGKEALESLNGMIHELEGDFSKAQRCFRHVLAASSGNHLLAKHLAAVQRNRRRGEI